jgi:hypothetical protein
MGEKSIKKLLKQALDLRYKIFVLKNNNEKISLNIEDIDKYYFNTSLGTKFKFGIEK